MKRLILGLAAALLLALPAAAQTLVSSCSVAYPAGTSSRLCTEVDTIVTGLSGKQAGDPTLTALAGLTWSSGIGVVTETASDVFSLTTVGSATGNILNKAAGDALYEAIDPDLGCIAANTTQGYLVYTGAGTCAYRTFAAGTGTTVTNGSGVSGATSINVTYGTTSGTAAQGNDSRITGAAQTSSNLSDLGNIPAARASLNVGLQVYGTGCATDANCTPVVTNGNPLITTATYTASRNINLAATNATANMVWFVHHGGAGAFNALVKDNGSGTTLCTLALNQGCAVTWSGSAWVLVIGPA